jgi:hypothetical protein
MIRKKDNSRQRAKTLSFTRAVSVLLILLMVFSFLPASGASEEAALLSAEDILAEDSGDEVIETDAETDDADAPAEAATEPAAEDDTETGKTPEQVETVETETDTDNNTDNEIAAYDEAAEVPGVMPQAALSALNLNELDAGASGTGWAVTTGKTLTFNTGATDNEYTVTQNDTSHGFTNIVVNSSVTTTITINGISLTNSTNGVPCFKINSGAKVTLILNGKNTLIKGGSSGNNAGLNVPYGASIIIQGDGELIAQGGYYSAGIGSDSSTNGGNITITGNAKVNAFGGSSGAGIGGGSTRNGGTIIISDHANVIATHTTTGSNGAGIGGGSGSSTAAGGNGGNITITDNATVHASGGDMAAGIGGGRFGVGGIININGSAWVEATGGGNTSNSVGAGIGGGGRGVVNGTTFYGGDGGNITIGGSSTVIAIGGRSTGDYSTGGAGIGGGASGVPGTIVIGDKANVTATGGTGGVTYGSGAGIGSGPKVRTGNDAYPSTSTSTITIKDTAIVVAKGTGSLNAGSAGIGAGSKADSGTINISITGGHVEATGSGNSAGIGGAVTGGGGTISIGGTANVTARGGNSAGIGGGSTGTGTKLTLDSSATVRAYSGAVARPAIHAASVAGDGYFVNAYFTNTISTSQATALDVYPNGDFTSKMENSPELPSSYRCFAYTTKNTESQLDRIQAYDTSGVLLGTVVRSDNGVADIESVNSTAALLVKLSKAGAGKPSVTNIRKDESPAVAYKADFTSKGHSFTSDYTFSEGGFKYSTSWDSATDALTGGDIKTKQWASYSTSNKTETVTGLEPNTSYYMTAYLIATKSSDTSSTTSSVYPFATPPWVVSASAVGSSAEETTALVSAPFYESVGGDNVPITDVTIYYDTKAINMGNLPTGNNKKELTKVTDFTDAGVTDYAITGLAVGTYYFLIVIENENGDTDSRLFTYTYTSTPEINVSVPIKLIFAAFETDSGAITAPNYHIKNNGEDDVDVTLNGLTVETADGLALVAAPPGTGEINLTLQGTGTNPPLSDTGYLTEAVTNVPLGTLTAADGAADTWNFTLTGAYNGSFAEAKKPVYLITFSFALSDP